MPGDQALDAGYMTRPRMLYGVSLGDQRRVRRPRRQERRQQVDDDEAIMG
jgi:hypothetical protein